MQTELETWTAMNGALVFDFTICLETPPWASVRIYCRRERDDVLDIKQIGSAPHVLEHHFNSGVRVNGVLSVTRHAGDKQQAQVLLIGDLVFEDLGGHRTNFNGTMASLPIKAAAPAPSAPAWKEDSADSARPEPAPDQAPGQVPALPWPAQRAAEATRNADLFPYIYLRPWDELDPDALRRCFAQAPEKFSEHAFYTELLTTKTLLQMRALALQFISGKAVFDDEFVASTDTLQGLMPLFSKVPALMRAPGSPATVVDAIGTHFARTPSQMRVALAAPDYLTCLAGLWQSYIALLISVDFNDALLADIGSLLVTAHWLDYLFNPPPGAAPLDQARFDGLLQTSIRLPEALFPLPEAADSAAPSGAAVAPYAMGELQMVRQRLLRQELGELAHIENIMPRERRELSRKRTQAQMSAELHHSSGAEALESQAGDARNDLREQTRQTVAEKAVSNQYKNFQTSYGPPTEATLNGSWTECTLQGKNPGADDVTRFARDILNRSVSSITREVSQLRSRSSFEQAEDSVTSVIDNSAGETQLVCALRWVNTVYQASVANYGRRLMIEFRLPQPAAGLVRQRQSRRMMALPVPLRKAGVLSFASIGRDNYATLAADYDVSELCVPPAPRKVVSVTLRGGDEKQVAVPSGYCVASASVDVIGPAAACDGALILVGREKFKAGDLPGQAREFGEELSIAVAAVALTLAAAPTPTPAPAVPTDPAAGTPSAPPPPPDSAPAELLINVALVCEPSDSTFDQWRIATYDAILKGYQHQVRLFASDSDAALGRARGQRSARAARQIEHTQLRQGCMRLLLQQALAKGAVEDGGAGLPDPCLLQFLHEALEWSEMSTRYYAGAGQDGPLFDLDQQDDAGMDAFLEADMARVMIPADPAQVLPLLYFLASGQRWKLAPELAPVHAAHGALVQTMKQPQSGAGRHEGTGWEIVVPTAMQMLDAGFRIGATPAEVA